MSCLVNKILMHLNKLIRMEMENVCSKSNLIWEFSISLMTILLIVCSRSYGIL